MSFPSDIRAKNGTLMLCHFCFESAEGLSLDELNAKASARGIGTEIVDCMAACDHGPAAAITSPGAWTYLLGNLTADDQDALLWGAEALAGSADGLLPWEGRPARYRELIRGRIPPLPVKR